MNDPDTPLEGRLKRIAQASPTLMAAMAAARQAADSLGLRSWCIAAGAVRNLVWDHLHGRAPAASLGEVDLVYFDQRPDAPSEQALHAQLRRLHPLCDWDVTNQAWVHRWYAASFGQVVEPLGSLAEGIASWPEFATCVGLSCSAHGPLQVVAPHGLHQLFAMEVQHNPARASLAVARERVRAKRWLQRWPGLRLTGALATAD